MPAKQSTEKNYIHEWSIGLFTTFQNLKFTTFMYYAGTIFNYQEVRE